MFIVSMKLTSKFVGEASGNADVPSDAGFLLGH